MARREDIDWSTMKTLADDASRGLILHYVDRTAQNRGYEVFAWYAGVFLRTVAEGDETDAGPPATDAYVFKNSYLSGALEVPGEGDAFALAVRPGLVDLTQATPGALWGIPADPDNMVFETDIASVSRSEVDLVSHTVAAGKTFWVVAAKVFFATSPNKNFFIRLKRGSTTIANGYLASAGNSNQGTDLTPGTPVPIGSDETVKITGDRDGRGSSHDIAGVLWGYEV